MNFLETMGKYKDELVSESGNWYAPPSWWKDACDEKKKLAEFLKTLRGEKTNPFYNQHLLVILEMDHDQRKRLVV